MKQNSKSIFRVEKNKDNPYIIMNKTILNDNQISWKAKGILAYLLSLPDDWQIYESEVASHSSDGLDSLSSGIKELIEQGYINRERKRNDNGQLKGYEYDWELGANEPNDINMYRIKEILEDVK